MGQTTPANLRLLARFAAAKSGMFISPFQPVQLYGCYAAQLAFDVQTLNTFSSDAQAFWSDKSVQIVLLSLAGYLSFDFLCCRMQAIVLLQTWHMHAISVHHTCGRGLCVEAQCQGQSEQSALATCSIIQVS